VPKEHVHELMDLIGNMQLTIQFLDNSFQHRSNVWAFLSYKGSKASDLSSLTSNECMEL
jgi:hypothetical protein